MSRYAAQTEVPADRSRGEIERTLSRYGATGFAYGWEADQAMLAFNAHGRRVVFRLRLPTADDPEFAMTEGGRSRSRGAAVKAAEQAARQRWRALALVIKAKLEAAESGIESFESLFLAQIQLPNGQRVGDWAQPQIERAYQTGQMPPLLPAPALTGSSCKRG